MEVSLRPAYPSVFARISTEIGWQYGSRPISQNTDTRVSRKYRNCDVNDASWLPAKPIVVRCDGESSFVDICIFQAISGAEIYDQS